MFHTPAAISLTVTTFVFASAAWAQTPHEAAADQPAAAALDAASPLIEQSPADAAFAPIGRAVRNLQQSLANRGGVSPADHGVLQSLRERAEAFTAEFPDDIRGLAVELQLSMWLKDEQRIEDTYQRIIARQQDNQAARGSYARYLVRQNRYADALDVLEAYPPDPAEHLEATLILSQCLFAQHRFQEALDVLMAVPQETLSSNWALQPQVTSARKIRLQYMQHWEQEQQAQARDEAGEPLPQVMLLTSRGPILLELFENDAPNTVANFIHLADQGFYNGTRFHQVLPNQYALGGDPNSKDGSLMPPGTGNPGYYLPDEHLRDGARKHFSGSIAMYKQDASNTAGSQFYLTVEPLPDFNDTRTVFGRVLEGLEVVRSLQRNDVIESVTVLRRRGHDYRPTTLPINGSTPAPSIADWADWPQDDAGTSDADQAPLEAPQAETETEIETDIDTEAEASASQ